MSAGESERGPANAASHTMPDSAGALARGSGPGGRDMRTLGACVHALASTRTHRDAHRPALAARKPGWVPPWRSSRLASITRQDIAPRVMCAAERAHAARPLRPAPAREMERATGELPRKGAHTPRRPRRAVRTRRGDDTTSSASSLSSASMAAILSHFA